MTEIIPEQIVDLSNCIHLSPAGADEEHSDARLRDEREERERWHSGQTSSDECKKSGTEMDPEYDDHESSTTLRQIESLPESSDRTTECSTDDPDVKPTHSYIALIAMAILSCPNKKMILGDIYQYISDNFPYYRNKDKSWRNSIRHNLSLNECFIKAGRSENGKGNYWAIHPANLEDFANGDFRRRRARRRVRRSNPFKFGIGSSPQAPYYRSIGSFSSSFFPYRADDSGRLLPSLTYIRPAKKSFAIDSIMGSCDSSYFYSPISVRSYPSLSLQSNREYLGGSSRSLLLHSSPTCVAEVSSTSVPNYVSKSLETSAFSAYLGSKGVAQEPQSFKPETWQETLSKLREQLWKASPWLHHSQEQGALQFKSVKRPGR